MGDIPDITMQPFYTAIYPYQAPDAPEQPENDTEDVNEGWL